MQIETLPKAQRDAAFSRLEQHLCTMGPSVFVKYLELGTHTVRLINYSAAFTYHVEAQLAYCLREHAPQHDATLVIWQGKAVDAALALCSSVNVAQYRRLRVQKLTRKAADMDDVCFAGESISTRHPLISISMRRGITTAWNPDTNTHYYGVENLDAEALIEHGHLCVQTLNKILKGPASNLAHGAVVGLNGTGVLLCASGNRGKSTLAVTALLHGFDYVTDDYLVLGKEGGILRAWPIYSIVTLTPAVYQTLAPRLEAKFVSNNARKDKYVLNVAAYHPRFAAAYPVRICMLPVFTTEATPRIEAGGKEEAVEELVFSTTRQMGDEQDAFTIRRLLNFVDDLPFYRFFLTRNIDRNICCLREFLNNHGKQPCTQKQA